MEPTFRAAFNQAFSPARHRSYLDALEKRVGGTIPFRVAETPVFLPAELRHRLATHARELVRAVNDPALIARLSSVVPARWATPHRDHGAHCIQVDLAVVQGPDGTLDGRLVELQGFPSLYGLTVVQTEVLAETLRSMPGLDRDWTCLFDFDSADAYRRFLTEALVGDGDPRETVLLDLSPSQQKTWPDFEATRQLTGVEAVCPTTLIREGRTLFRETSDGRRVPVRRIFHRVVFDELERSGTVLPYQYTDDLDVTWVPHPDWYWIWSKYTVPFLDHPCVPRARFLSDVETLPDDLSGYVLKPLFSFAGTGVQVDVTREAIEKIPEASRHEWLLQDKITYAPALHTPEGHPVKAEIRFMFLRRDQDREYTLTLSLARLSRGKMHGVDHNKDLDWVGGTVVLWPRD